MFLTNRNHGVKIRTDHPIMADRKSITLQIGDFWDKMSEGWRIIWGPHIHHGYYENNQSIPPLQAQEKLLVKLAELLEIPLKSNILDVGCGMGASSIYLAKKFQAIVTGITLSHKQVSMATQQCRSENITNAKFIIEDALSLNSFNDNSFDIVWSLESCEQFYDKGLFLQQAFRVLKPGGQLMIATWCSDRDEYSGVLARQYQKLCYAFDVPYMPTVERYRSLLESHHFHLINSFDWSTYVAKSWDVGISLVHMYSFLQIIMMSGWRGFRFAQQIKLMRDAFKEGRVKYGVFIAKKLR